MKKFKFTLQAVHKVRELKSERENITLGELLNAADAADLKVSHIETMRNEAIEKYLLKLNSGGQVSAMEMELNSMHFASLDSLQKEAQNEADAKRKAYAHQLEAARAARRDVKITDKLRTDQKKRHDLELDRQEQKNLDEIVVTKFARSLHGTK